MPDSSCLLLFGGILLVAVALTVYTCHRLFQNRLCRREAEAAALVQQKQNNMLQTALRIRKQALALISWELHEETCQVLGMSGTLLLNAVDEGDSSPAIDSETVQQTAERLFATNKELKHIANVLKAQEQPMQTGLAGLIEQQIELISSLKTSKIICNFNHVEFRDTLLPPYETLLLCCMVQDALTYILRHTSSDVAHVDLSAFNHNCWLIFIYNGKEYSMQQSRPALLEIIRETAALLGATLSFETSEHLCNKMVIKLGMGGLANSFCSPRLLQYAVRRCPPIA